MKNKKVVVIGGGTGSHVILKGLKVFRDLDLSAIVTMSDDGGSTGKLRDELGVLPAGDVRQCLVALSDSPEIMRDLFNYRFENGGLTGHNAGNILLAALEKITGSFDKAVSNASQLLAVKGEVIPVTCDNLHLEMILNNDEVILGEDTINHRHDVSFVGVKEVHFSEVATLNPKAKQAILNADMVVIAPGNTYGSILPNLIVPGMKEVLSDTKARKVMCVNLMAKKEHCLNWNVEQFIKEIQKYIGDIVDIALYNTNKPDHNLLEIYKREGTFVKRETDDCNIGKARLVGTDLLAKGIFINPNKKDLIQRTLIRHDSMKLATAIYGLL